MLLLKAGAAPLTVRSLCIAGWRPVVGLCKHLHLSNPTTPLDVARSSTDLPAQLRQLETEVLASLEQRHPPDPKALHSLILGMGRAGAGAEAARLARAVAAQGAALDDRVLVALVGGLVRAGRVAEAQHWFDQHRQRAQARGGPLARAAVAALVDGWAVAGNLQAAQRVARLSPQPVPARVWASLAFGCARGRQAADLLRAYRYLLKALRAAAAPDASDKRVEPRAFTGLLAEAGRAGDLRLAQRVFGLMQRHQVPLGRTAYNGLMAAAARARRPDVAEHTYAEMTARGIEPDAYAYTVLLEAHARAGHREQAATRLDNMRARGMRPPLRALFWMLRSLLPASGSQDLPAALELLQHIRLAAPSSAALQLPYALLIMAAGRAGDAALLKRLEEEAMQARVPRGPRLLAALVNAHRRLGSAASGLAQLPEAYSPRSPRIAFEMVSALVGLGRSDEARELATKSSAELQSDLPLSGLLPAASAKTPLAELLAAWDRLQRLASPGAHCYNTLLLRLADVAHTDPHALAVFERYFVDAQRRQLPLRSSVVAAQVAMLLNRGEVQEPARLLLPLLAHTPPPTTSLCRQALLACARRGRLADALRLHAHLRVRQPKPASATEGLEAYHALLEACVGVSATEAERLRQEMELLAGLPPDAHAYTLVVCAQAAAGDTQGARATLELARMRQLTVGSRGIDALLRALYASGHHEEADALWGQLEMHRSLPLSSHVAVLEGLAQAGAADRFSLVLAQLPQLDDLGVMRARLAMAVRLPRPLEALQEVAHAWRTMGVADEDDELVQTELQVRLDLAAVAHASGQASERLKHISAARLLAEQLQQRPARARSLELRLRLGWLPGVRAHASVMAPLMRQLLLLEAAPTPHAVHVALQAYSALATTLRAESELWDTYPADLLAKLEASGQRVLPSVRVLALRAFAASGQLRQQLAHCVAGLEQADTQVDSTTAAAVTSALRASADLLLPLPLLLRLLARVPVEWRLALWRAAGPAKVPPDVRPRLQSLLPELGATEARGES